MGSSGPTRSAPPTVSTEDLREQPHDADTRQSFGATLPSAARWCVNTIRGSQISMLTERAYMHSKVQNRLTAAQETRAAHEVQLSELQESVAAEKSARPDSVSAACLDHLRYDDLGPFHRRNVLRLSTSSLISTTGSARWKRSWRTTAHAIPSRSKRNVAPSRSRKRLQCDGQVRCPSQPLEMMHPGLLSHQLLVSASHRSQTCSPTRCLPLHLPVLCSHAILSSLRRASASIFRRKLLGSAITLHAAEPRRPRRHTQVPGDWRRLRRHLVAPSRRNSDIHSYRALTLSLCSSCS